jgi:energy-coupling factor transporter transmembrane protein EcfT
MSGGRSRYPLIADFFWISCIYLESIWSVVRVLFLSIIFKLHTFWYRCELLVSLTFFLFDSIVPFNDFFTRQGDKAREDK